MILGNGTPQQAQWFREDYDIGVPVVVDPERRAYAAVEAKRPAVLSPGTIAAGLRAFRKGFRQTRTMGDARQLGGVFVITSAGEMPYRYLSRYAGDHPRPADVVAALEKARQNVIVFVSTCRNKTPA